MLSEKLIKELSEILRDDYGLNLEENVISSIGNAWVSFVQLLLKIENEANKSC